jgi:hypothetical protein
LCLNPGAKKSTNLNNIHRHDVSEIRPIPCCK